MNTLAKERFPWKAFIQSVMTIAVPVALQNLLTTTGSMVDTMMLAPLGELTVGAVGLCAQFSSLMFTGYWGFVGGGMLFFAQYWGAKDDDGIDRSYGITLAFMMTVAAVFASLALLLPASAPTLPPLSVPGPLTVNCASSSHRVRSTVPERISTSPEN